MRVMPIFLPFKSVILLNSGFAISEKTCRLVAPIWSTYQFTWLNQAFGMSMRAC